MIGCFALGSLSQYRMTSLGVTSATWLVSLSNAAIDFHDNSFSTIETGKPLPKVEELHRNISLVLVNSHRSTSKPRPQMPGIVYVGGAHITPAKPLPIAIQEFIDNSPHGVVLFSLGSLLQSSQLPQTKIQLFLKAFSRLKQRVIWKYEDESLEVPPNVLIKKWLPQSDILAHPNVVLFITHGGKT